MNIDVLSHSKEDYVTEPLTSDSVFIVNFQKFIGNTDMVNRAAKDLVHRNALGESSIAIVSAIPGLTSELFRVCDDVERGNQIYEVEDIIREIKRKHLAFARDLGLSTNSQGSLSKRFDILSLFLREDFEWLRSGSNIRNKVLSRGSWFSAIVLSEILDQHFVKSKIIDSAQFIKVESMGPVIDEESTEEEVGLEIVPRLNRGIVPIIANFAVSTVDGRFSILSQKAEDTGMILGRALGAEKVTYIKDTLAA